MLLNLAASLCRIYELKQQNIVVGMRKKIKAYIYLYSYIICFVNNLEINTK
jgi:hypothetical protein